MYMLCLGVSTLVSHSVVALTMRHWIVILYLVLLYIILSKNKISALLYKMLNSMIVYFASVHNDSLSVHF